MQFRTELPVHKSAPIPYPGPLLMLGSCFTDEIGSRLEMDGFNVTANPLGPVYNPVTLNEIISRACNGERFTEQDLVTGSRGWHCLTFASRYSGFDPREVIAMVNNDFQLIADAVASHAVVILTLGTSYVFTHRATGKIVGNCHKLHPEEFSRHRLTVDEISAVLHSITSRLNSCGCRVIFTVSPIRHLADGHHGNTLSKSALHLAIDTVGQAGYFPAYEALIDDLRDYRFYAADMKHPSPVAVDYIYELFAKTYFDKATAALAGKARAENKFRNHRQIL